MCDVDISSSPFPGPVQSASGTGDRWQRIKNNLKNSYTQNPLRRPETPSFSGFLKGKSLEE
jgi:hypothetical protein